MKSWNLEKIEDKLSTALISDILDEEGYENQVLSMEIKPNFDSAKIFGKARIMTLKPLDKNNDYTDVYRGLYFIESLDNGDILVIGNAFKDKAFFGEIMSTLANYHNLCGVIVDGCTRDKLETIKMKYPVFARNNIARDIRKRGVVDKLDLDNLEIDGVLIRKGDYLFGDLDGVIIIPFEIKDRVLEKALRIADNENKIKESIKKGTKIREIINKFGEF